MVTQERQHIYCDCCGDQVMAMLVGEYIVITDRRHGQKHVAKIPVRLLLTTAQIPATTRS